MERRFAQVKLLQNILQSFGNQWITDIRFITSPLSEAPLTQKKVISPLTTGEKKYLSNVLDQVDDPDFKEKLESLGKALLSDIKSSKGK